MTRLRKIKDELEVISWPTKERVFDPDVGGALVTRDGVELMLHRLPVKGGRPVLLLHGASAGADTFLTPRGGRSDQLNLVEYLVKEEFEPWLLDWRGSKDVIDMILGSNEKASKLKPGLFDFNQAAENDIAAALDAIEYVKNEERKEATKSEYDEPMRIDAIGYCLGGAILAEALLKQVPGVHERLSHVVLMTIGFFYQMNAHGRLKAEAHLLKRVISDHPDRRVLDPRVDGESGEIPPENGWPAFVETLYQAWRHPYDKARMDHENIPERDRYVLEMFNRVSFMFGEPYHETNLVPEIHHRLTKVLLDPNDEFVRPLSPGTLIEARDGDRIVARGEVAYRFDDASNQVLVLCRCRELVEQEQPSPEEARRAADWDLPMFKIGQSLLADGQSIGTVKDDSNDEPPLLPSLFGAIPLQLFMHGAENLRSGVATDLKKNENEKKGVEDQQDITPTPVLDAFERNEADAYKGFAALDHLTLIGGGLNRLWHRDSVDRMGAWLDRYPRMRKRWTKRMLIDYGHQDLLWGRKASEDVFPKILKGLGKVDKAEGGEQQSSTDERPNQVGPDSRPETAA